VDPHFHADLDPVHIQQLGQCVRIRIQGIDGDKFKNFTVPYFFDQKCYVVSMKDVQDTEEASSPQKKTSSTSKQYIS
jgi:hypothetical protein